MPFPASVQTVTVTAGASGYRALDGSPYAGAIRFTPSVSRVTSAEQGVIALGTVNATLGASGGFTATLLATDADGFDPSGWTYRVDEEFTNAPSRTYSISLPAAVPSVTLPALAPVESTTGTVSSPAVLSVNDETGVVTLTAADVSALPAAGGTVSGGFVIDRHGAPAGYPVGQAGAVESLSVPSSFAGGEDDGQAGQFDSTGRLNLYSYQRANVGSYGETIRHFAMRKDSKQMEAWYFPSGGYDGSRNPVGAFKPVVWAGAHWEANNHASNHKHWSVETPDSTGAIQTRFEVRWGNPTVDNAIAGLDKTMIATNLADFVVRCTNGQEMRLTSPNGEEKKLVFSRDAEGDPQYRRWAIRSTNETETGSSAGSNFQIARYDDTGTFQDNPIVVSRATGNVTLGPGLIARRASPTVSSLSLNTTSLGGGVGVLAIGNATTAPSANPTAGIVMYVANGRLKIRQPDGTDQFVALTAT